MKLINTLIAVSFLACSLYAQSSKERDSRKILRDRTYQPEATTISGSDNSGNDQLDVSESDTGAQRPVLLKKNGLSYFFGYDSKLFYQSNPLADSAELKSEIATGVWKSTFFSGAGLGVIDMDSYILTPYVGFSLSSTDYIKSDELLNDQDYESSSAYALLLAQFGNGWSGKVGVSYSSDYLTSAGEEVFKEFYPNISVMKSYSISDAHRGIFETGIGYHNSEVDPLLEGDDIDFKRNVDLFASYALSSTLGAITLSPKYKISYRDYQNGSNKDRHDLIHELSLDCSAYLTSYLKFSASIDYINQDDSEDDADYENYDVGASINLMARF